MYVLHVFLDLLVCTSCVHDMLCIYLFLCVNLFAYTFAYTSTFTYLQIILYTCTYALASTYTCAYAHALDCVEPAFGLLQPLQRALPIHQISENRHFHLEQQDRRWSFNWHKSSSHYPNWQRWGKLPMERNHDCVLLLLWIAYSVAIYGLETTKIASSVTSSLRAWRWWNLLTKVGCSVWSRGGHPLTKGNI